jgi:hypothetical protein
MYAGAGGPEKGNSMTSPVEIIGDPVGIQAIQIAAIGQIGVTPDSRQVVVQLRTLEGRVKHYLFPVALAESLSAILVAQALTAKHLRGDHSYKGLPLPEFEITAPVLALTKDQCRRLRERAPALTRGTYAQPKGWQDMHLATVSFAETTIDIAADFFHDPNRPLGTD